MKANPIFVSCPVYIPLKSPGGIDFKLDSCQSVKLASTTIIESSFSLYFLKFIAGSNNTFSRYADVSIEDLYLWSEVRIGSNKLAKKVCSTTMNFKNSLAKLSNCQEIKIENLIETNIGLYKKTKSNRIRNNKIIAGNPKTNPYAFYCIPPELILDYLNNLIEFINSNVGNSINKALEILQQFIFIHPFKDGNGRMSRLLLLKAMKEKNGLIYSCLLSIYLKNINRDNYHKAVNQYQNNDIDALRQFHFKAIQWTNQSAKTLSDFIQEYTNKVGQQNIDSDSNYSQVVIKTELSQKVDESIFQFHSKKANKNIYVNTALLNVLNQFDYYLRYELRKHQNN